MSESERPSRTYSLASVLLIFIAPALGGFNFGYDIGSTSYTLVQMQSDALSGVLWWHAVASSPVLQGVILSTASAGALIGSTIVFAVSDTIGRRRELQIGALLYFLGAAIEVCTRMASAWKGSWAIPLLILGRLIYGIGMGISMHAAPTYLSEMCPAQVRGAAISSKEACIVLGILTGYSIGYTFSLTVGGWAYTYACSMVSSAAMLLFSFSIPRSCRWLLLKGREEEALQSLQFVFYEGYAELEFSDMKEKHEASMTPIDDLDEPKTIWHSSYRAPLVAGLGLVVLQQITGQPSVLSYASPILQNAGLSELAPIFIAAFKLVATLAAAFTVEKFGRKKLLYIGCSLMLAALAILSIVFGKTSKLAMTAVLLSLFVYIGGYQVGFGPISWLLIGEIFPLSVRGQAVALSVQMNFLLNSLVQFVVPVLEKMVGLNVMFAIFAILTGLRYDLYSPIR